MPVKGTKLLEGLKKSTVIATYTTEIPVAPAAGHVSVFADLASGDRHRHVEVTARMKELMAFAREDNYSRPLTADTFYLVPLKGSKNDIVKVADAVVDIDEVAITQSASVVFAENEAVMASGGTLTLASGSITDSASGFVTAGFVEGDMTLAGATTLANDGVHAITDVTANVLTFAAGTFAAEAGVSGTTLQQTLLDTITYAGATFVSGGLVVDEAIVITESDSNNGTVTPSVVTTTVLSVPAGTVVAGTEVSGTPTMKFTQIHNAGMPEGWVGLGIDATVVTGNLGSLILDTAFKEIIDWMREQSRLTV